MKPITKFTLIFMLVVASLSTLLLVSAPAHAKADSAQTSVEK